METTVRSQNRRRPRRPPQSQKCQRPYLTPGSGLMPPYVPPQLELHKSPRPLKGRLPVGRHRMCRCHTRRRISQQFRRGQDPRPPQWPTPHHPARRAPRVRGEPTVPSPVLSCTRSLSPWRLNQKVQTTGARVATRRPREPGSRSLLIRLGSIRASDNRRYRKGQPRLSLLGPDQEGKC